MDEIEIGIRYRRETGPIQLEGRLRLPDVDAPAPGVLLCHPHPMGGGDMDVPLMVLISEALCLLGAAVLRFNFAGVGSSRGVFTDGAYEPYDVQAAYRYLQSRTEVDGESINLVGWSFGSWMALVALVEGQGLPAGSLVAIAPPLVGCDWSAVTGELAKSPVVRNYIVGDRDRFCPVAALQEFTSAISEQDVENITVLPGADHFLFGREQEVARLVAELL